MPGYQGNNHFYKCLLVLYTNVHVYVCRMSKSTWVLFTAGPTTKPRLRLTSCSSSTVTTNHSQPRPAIRKYEEVATPNSEFKLCSVKSGSQML